MAAEVWLDGDRSLCVGPRVIPVPATISPAARGFLQMDLPPVAMPAVADRDGWRRAAAEMDGRYGTALEPVVARLPAAVETREIAGVTVHCAIPAELRHPDRVHVTIHGGGWVFLGGTFARAEAATRAVQFGCTTFGIDYRRPPDHPFPAAVDDVLAVYRHLVERHDPRKLAVSGASAGGNLTAALALRARDAGLPMPAAVGLLTPALDLTRAGDTHRTLDGIDTVLRSLSGVVEVYAAGHDLRDPYLSPLFGDFSKGFPPTFLQSGTRDRLLSDTVRMHRALVNAGVDTELHVWEAMPHGGFGGLFGTPTPEDDDMSESLIRFVERRLGP